MKDIKTFKINNDEELTFEKGKIIFRGKPYKKIEWYSLCASFREFNEEEIELRYLPSNFSASYLKETYLKNIKKATIFSFIIPSIIFFLFGLGSIIIPVLVDNYNSQLETEVEPIYNSFFIAIGVFMILAAFTLLFRYLLGYRSCFKKVKGQNRYHIMSKQEHQKNLTIFDKHIGKEKE